MIKYTSFKTMDMDLLKVFKKKKNEKFVHRSHKSNQWRHSRDAGYKSNLKNVNVLFFFLLFVMLDL